MTFQTILREFDFLAILGVVVLGNFISVGWIHHRNRIQKQKLMENYLSHLQIRIETDDEFQRIIDQIRKDHKDEQ